MAYPTGVKLLARDQLAKQRDPAKDAQPKRAQCCTPALLAIPRNAYARRGLGVIHGFVSSGNPQSGWFAFSFPLNPLPVNYPPERHTHTHIGPVIVAGTAHLGTWGTSKIAWGKSLSMSS